MRFVCSHEDALWYWYRMGPERLCRSKRVLNPSLDDTTLSLRRLSSLDLAGVGMEKCPREVLGQNASSPPELRCIVKPSLGGSAPAGIRSARWYDRLPEGSLFHIGSGAYVCSPEFALLQLSYELGEVDLIRLCCHLFSEYFVDMSSGQLVSREAICSRKTMEGFLGLCEFRRGRPSLARAMTHSVERAASPREIELYLLTSLPPRLGGYGLSGCSLNPERLISQQDSAILDRPDRKCVRMDLLWERRRVALEYQGAHRAKHHSEDRGRINMLSSMGYTILQVDNEQMRSARRFDALMDQLAKSLRRRLPSHDQEWLRKNSALRERLLGPGRMRL